MDVGYIDLETDISQRSEFVKEFFDRLDDVVWVLGKFCEHADWLMGRECRISQLMGEVHLASTEVEGVLKFAEVFDLNMGEMLLLANGCELSQEYKEVRKQLQSILPRLLPYCSNELSDMSKLLMASEEENEPTKFLNRQFLKMTNEIVKNFAHVLQLLFFHIDNAYQRFEALNDAQIKILFDKQYMQYCNDNAQMLQEYVDDIDDVREAKSELKELFSMPSLLKCYKRNVGKPHLLIKEMRQSCMFEHHLVEIYAYQAKMEKIKNIKAPAPPPQIVINGDIIEGDKVKEKTVIPNVCNYKPKTAELSDDDRTVRAIGILNTERLIKHKYDYTWVMQVTNETDGMPSYDSPQSFLTDMKRLQKEAGLNFEVGLPDISSMNKELSEVTGTFPNWRFIDIKKTKAFGHTVYRDTTETNRRINIAKRYYNAFRKEYKTIDNT